MAQQITSDKVLVDVFEKDRKYFASIEGFQLKHSLGPADSRDDIYQLIYGFLSDLKLVKEINRSPPSGDQLYYNRWV